jgi:hypothetical protein
MNPRQNFYSSVFEQIMNYKREREFVNSKNLFFDPVIGLGLFASVLVLGVFSGYVKLPPPGFKTTKTAMSPIIKFEERAAADIFSPDLSSASEPNTAPTTASFVLVPSEDGYVTADSPQKSYGSEGYLKIDNSSQKIAFLKFKVPATTTFHKVVLRLNPTDSTESGGDVSIVNENLWSEKLLTFNSKPSEGEVRVGPIGAVSARVPKMIDITNYIVAGKTYTFKLSTTGTESVEYSSRESSSDTSPALVFTE